MATYGLLSSGFVPKPQEVIEAEVQAELKDFFGNSIPLHSKSIFGQLATILSERYALLWELAEAINASQAPDAATGARLDDICALTGTVRNPATESTVTAWLTGDPATAIPAGNQGSVDSTGIKFRTLNAETLVAAAAWAITTAYVVGDIVTNASRCYYCITAGTSAGAGGPVSTSDNITDNTVHWQYMGEGTAYADGEMGSVDTGPKVALAGDLIVIETPVSGWLFIKNRLDADEGEDLETDAALRVRREIELASAGTATIDAVRAALLAVDNVDSVNLFVNNTDTTDGDGVPPHAVEALVKGTHTDQDLFDALLANIAAGIQTHGVTSGTSTDSEGTDHTMKYTEPAETVVHVGVTLIYDADLYPADGDTQIKAAIASFADDFVVGQDVYDSALIAQCFSVLGVVDVTALLVEDTDPPTTAVQAIGTREIATIDTGDIDVSSSAV